MVPESLRPLKEIKVILHLALDELLYRDRLFDLVLRERVCRCRLSASVPCVGRGVWDLGEGFPAALTLQDLEVLDVGILGVDIELDSGHGDIEEDAIVDLAKGSSGAKLRSAQRSWCAGEGYCD